ncbi:MAG TPA: cupin domain-containing protein [Acidisarcina sp.]
MKADELKALLGLSPHPREGGCFLRTWESPLMLPRGALPARYKGDRLCGTAIYYLLEPNTFSEMHRLQSDEVFHFYTGAPVEMLQLRPDGGSSVATLGLDFNAGMRPQIVVPQGVWQGSRIITGSAEANLDFSLLGCTVSPGFEFEDYEAGNREHLVRLYPQHAAMIEALTRS